MSLSQVPGLREYRQQATWSGLQGPLRLPLGPAVSTMVTQAPNIRTPIVAQIWALHDRLLKAEILVAYRKVHPVVDMPDHYMVEGSKGLYLVKDGKCSCPDAASRNGLIGGRCKHLLASIIYQQELGPARTIEANPKGPSTDKELEAKVADLYR
jgi:hypothetical protein